MISLGTPAFYAQYSSSEVSISLLSRREHSFLHTAAYSLVPPNKHSYLPNTQHTQCTHKHTQRERAHIYTAHTPTHKGASTDSTHTYIISIPHRTYYTHMHSHTAYTVDTYITTVPKTTHYTHMYIHSHIIYA